MTICFNSLILFHLWIWGCCLRKLPSLAPEKASRRPSARAAIPQLLQKLPIAACRGHVFDPWCHPSVSHYFACGIVKNRYSSAHYEFHLSNCEYYVIPFAMPILPLDYRALVCGSPVPSLNGQATRSCPSLFCESASQRPRRLHCTLLERMAGRQALRRRPAEHCSLRGT